MCALEGKNADIATRVKSQAEKDAAEKAARDKAAKEGKGSGKVKFVSEDENYWYYKVKTWEKYDECLSKIAEKYYKNAKNRITSYNVCYTKLLRSNSHLH